MSVSTNNSNFDDELLSAYIDGELTDAERARVEKRLADDPAARELVAELRGLSRTLRSLPHEKLPADVRPDVMGQIRDQQVELPRVELSFARRLMWPALAIAAALMLMFVQDSGDRQEPEIAKVEVGGGELRDRPREEPEVLAFEAPAPVRAPAEDAAAPTEGMAVDESLRERDLRSDDAAEPSPAVDRAFDALASSDALASADAEFGIVHLTLTDLRSGAERFDRLLVSNGVQVINESSMTGPGATSGVPADSSVSDESSSASTLSTRAAGGLGGAATAPPENLPVTSGLEKDEKPELIPESEMVLVEAPPEQIKQILATCSQDTEAIEEVSIDPSASGTNRAPEKQRLAEYRQYARSAASARKPDGYVVTPAQQGVIAVLNSLPEQQTELPFSREAVAGVQVQQGWATKLNTKLPPTDLRQVEVEVNQRRDQFYKFSQEQQAANADKKLAKEKTSQPMRVLFLLHPSPEAAKK